MVSKLRFIKSSVVDQGTVFAITGTKLYVPILTLLTLLILLVLSLKAMKNCFTSENQVLKERLTGININLK